MIILSANTFGTNFVVENSLEFTRSSVDELTRSPSSNGNRKTFTLSYWIKKTSNTNGMYIFMAGSDGDTDYFEHYFRNDTIDVGSNLGGQLRSTATFTDTNWNHHVLRVDTTQSTSSNRLRFYRNGAQITDWAVENYPSLNVQYQVNQANKEQLFGNNVEVNKALDAKFAEVAMIDGASLAPSVFAVDNGGTWSAIDFAENVTFGTNGFYFEFKQNGTSANSGGLGADTSGNDHHFTVNNLTSGDQKTDVPPFFGLEN